MTGAALVNAQTTYPPEALADGSHQPVDCRVSKVSKAGRTALQLTPTGAATQQLLRLKDVELRTGTIEFEFFAAATSRFIGIAWHVESAESYEAVYFRPFRFRDPDPVSRRHAVQYVSHPDKPWRTLRTEFPDVYESACPLDPSQWVKARIEIAEQTVRVFAGDLVEPVMVLKRPFMRNGTGVALWTGAGTTGTFGAVSIKPRQANVSPAENQARSPSRTGGKEVDLLATVDPGKNALVGTWKKTAAGLEVSQKPFAQLVIPAELPDNYDIRFAFTRKAGREESVSLFVPVGDRSVGVFFAARGTHDGLGLINSAAVWTGPTARATTLVSGRSVQAAVSVRRQGARASISVQLDQEPWIDWEGPVTDLSLFSAYRIPPRRAGLSAFDNNTVFHSVRLRAVGSN